MTAVGIVLIAAILLGATSIAMTRAAALLETGSFALIILLGLWLVWRKMYYAPEAHPRLAPEELAYIRNGSAAPAAAEGLAAPKISWQRLLSYRQTWGLILGRFLLDPFWFFIINWFAVYLNSVGNSQGKSVHTVLKEYVLSCINAREPPD